MRLASRHGTPSWEALLGRLVLCAALCVCRADDDLVPVQFRASPRCSALCSRAQTPACSAPPAALPFCSHLPMDRLLAGRCQARLPHALHRDALACQLACEFQALLSRFDCLGGYSAKWDCHTCAVVYREWTCAMLVPVYPVPASASPTSSRPRKTQGPGPPVAGTSHEVSTPGTSEPEVEDVEDTPLRPCREFCHRVEEQCPYFHPTTKEQYAGEPVFICIDPNIPDLPSISNSSYGPPGNCYQPCHVNASHTPGEHCRSSGATTAAVHAFPGPATTASGAANSGGSSSSAGVRTQCKGWRATAVLVTVLWMARTVRTRHRHRLS